MKTRRAFPRAESTLVDRPKLDRFIVSHFIERGATTAAIVSVTEPKMNKFHRDRDDDGQKIPNPFFGHLVKVTFFTGKTGLDTEGQKAKVSEEPLQEHKWGHRFMESRTILQHNDRPDLYLILYPATDATWYETYYVDTRTGEIVNKDAVDPYLPVKDYSGDYGYRNFRFDSIHLAKIGGETVILKDSPYVTVE